MSKKAPSTTQLLVIAGFALSCFGILLFLWITFGGPTPFKAQVLRGQRFPSTRRRSSPSSPTCGSPASTSAKSRTSNSPPTGKLAMATIDIDDKYAPMPEDTRAILRTKTLLGETYVELTPGSRNGPKLADGGHPAAKRRSPNRFRSTRSSAPSTRRPAPPSRLDAERRDRDQGPAGQDLSDAFGELDTDLHRTSTNSSASLDTQRLAVKQLFRNGAVALNAFRGREGRAGRT